MKVHRKKRAPTIGSGDTIGAVVPLLGTMARPHGVRCTAWQIMERNAEKVPVDRWLGIIGRLLRDSRISGSELRDMMVATGCRPATVLRALKDRGVRRRDLNEWLSSAMSLPEETLTLAILFQSRAAFWAKCGWPIGGEPSPRADALFALGPRAGGARRHP